MSGWGAEVPASGSRWLTDLICTPLEGRVPSPSDLVPVTCGIPFPKGELLDVTRLAIFDLVGDRKTLQVRLLDSWSDGSVRWVLLDWLAEPKTEIVYRLAEVAARPPDPSAGTELKARLSDDHCNLSVDTGAARFALGTDSPGFPFTSVQIEGREQVDPQRCDLLVEDDRGRVFTPTIDTLSIEESGPVRVRARVEGQLTRANCVSLMSFSTQLDFFLGCPVVRVELSLTNPRAARHPGGLWQLGDGGSILIRDASLRFAMPHRDAPVTVIASSEPSQEPGTRQIPFEIYQDSSGGENWSSRNHLDRDQRPTTRFRGYVQKAGGLETRGMRSTPLVLLACEEQAISLAIPRFWQNFPKAIEVSDKQLRYRILPKQSAALHELQGGEQKTHTLFLGFGPVSSATSSINWSREPLYAHPSPEWYSQAEAVSHLVPSSQDPNSRYLDLVDAAIDGPSSFFVKREIVDEYGWRHFGDLYADHEALFHPGPDPLLSHYNNQYDAIAGFAIHFMRSGDARWFALMDELARHVVDIDLYNTDEDKSTYNRGQFWHTVHYIDAGISTHRAYPAAPGVGGGGPSTGNLYTTGLMLHYFLTGNTLSRKAVRQLGQYVIDADDGTKTIFRFIDRSYTGHVSESGFDQFHGPGRGPANAIVALVNACRLTGERGFLNKAEQLIQRCIHPLDDLDAGELLNAESRWYYTMFLQSLVVYLNHKVESSSLDERFAYARAALQHYANWAVDHEYPYLEKPEILEFPTETWAAQDLRKAEVFRGAAIYSSGRRRDALLARARFFFDDAVERLGSMPTYSRCRPLVLLMTNGFSQAYFDLHRADLGRLPPTPLGEIPGPQPFVTQKQRVKRKLLSVGLLTGFLSLVGLVVMAMFLWG